MKKAMEFKGKSIYLKFFIFYYYILVWPHDSSYICTWHGE